MKLYCGLDIFSSTNASLPPEFLKRKSIRHVRFVDRGTPEFIEHRSQVRRKLGLGDVSIPRYHWRLCSDGMVEGRDVEDHLRWIFDAIQTSKPLFEHLKAGYDDYLLSLVWNGPGLGQGPVLNVGVADLLCRHRVRMDLNFYSSVVE